jgi:hypothetical protein
MSGQTGVDLSDDGWSRALAAEGPVIVAVRKAIEAMHTCTGIRPVRLDFSKCEWRRFRDHLLHRGISWAPSAGQQLPDGSAGVFADIPIFVQACP